MGDLNDPYMRNRDAAVQARTKAQNRATVLQLKLIGQSHPTGLTTNLLKLFEPRPPLEYKPPPEKRKCPPYTGMAQFVSNFAEPDDPEYNPPVPEAETPAQRRARIQKLRMEKGALKAAEELQKYDPSSDPNTTGDPYKTLFVARLSYETSEHRLKREFEAYGPIKRIRIVTDKSTNKPRGYAFVEYVHTRDMKTAYKQADGRKIDNRRVLVDVERGRTVPNWRPRRLGGGLGSTRIGGGGEDANHKHLTRDSQQGASGGRPRSEEPRAKEDHRLDREKSRERGRDRDRDREKSRERSHDRTRDHDSREDRHHRDRERTKDRDRGRDRDRDRNRGRDKDYERDRRDRTRDKDYDRSGRDHDRERKYEKESGYEQTYEKEQPSEKERGLDGGYEHAHQWHDNEHDRHYDNYDSEQYEDGGIRYEHHED